VIGDRRKIVILGGGLAGLAAGYRLKQLGEDDFVIIEREAAPGGLLRTSREGGWEIDVLPHVFFSGDAEMIRLFHELVPESHPHRSRLGTLVEGTYTNYPFQLNVHQLPPPLLRSCLRDYLTALRDRPPGPSRARDLETHFLETFGREMTDRFFRPYNEKLWCTPLIELSTDWISRKIDAVDLDGMVRSFLGGDDERSSFGPHATFHYPAAGGIQRLAEALQERIGAEHLRMAEEIVAVDDAARTVSTARGTLGWERLIWTLPLSGAASLLNPALEPPPLLAYTGVTSVHVVANTLNLPEYHWIYFADSDLSIYRITRVDLLDPRYASGPHPLIVEVAHPGGVRPDEEAVEGRVLSELLGVGILGNRRDVVHRRVFFNSPAYVVHDHRREGALRGLRRLSSSRILTAGRFGDWAFYNMDDTIRSGFSAAERSMEPPEAS